MAYRLSGKDIIISGFEEGIAESPHKGLSDMRNVNIVSIPGEAAVMFKTDDLTIPPTVSAVAWSAVGATDVFTVSSTTNWYNGMAVTMNTSSGGGVATGRVYWVGDLSGATFKLYKNPSLIAGALLDVTADATGTMSSYTLTAIIDAIPSYQEPGTTKRNRVFFLDDTGRVWWVRNTGGTVTNTLVYIGNDTLTGTTGRAITAFLGYLIVFRTSTTDSLDLTLLDGTTDLDGASGWLYGWESISSVDQTVRPVISAQDNAMYYSNGSSRVGSIIQNAGSSFNPATSATYTENTSALALPEEDTCNALAELGTNLLIGGIINRVYVWDRISTSFNYPLILPENVTSLIVQTNSNAYIFAGFRGRIYITNGTNINLWKKIPDYLTGEIEPYITWQDATYWRNQIYFSFTAEDNSGVSTDNTSGIWAIDIETEALRMTNQLSYGAYTGTTTTIIPNILTNTPGGDGLYASWTNSTTYGVDYTTSTPYSNFESYIETELMPLGTFTRNWTGTQFEWKTSVPIGVNGTSESVRLQYRTNLSEAFTTIGTTSSSTGQVSDMYQANFQKAQWVQLRLVLSSNATTPTLCRGTELRLRDYPSSDQKN